MPPATRTNRSTSAGNRRAGKPASRTGNTQSTGEDQNAQVIVELTSRVESQEQAIQTLKEQLAQETESRNFFQLEKDRIYALYEVSQKQLTETRALIRSKDREIEELVENHQVSVKVYQQKIKDVLYGHQQDTTQLRLDKEAALKGEEEYYKAREEELRREIDALRNEIQKAKLEGEGRIREVKETHSGSIASLREQYEQQIWSLTKEYEQRLRVQLEETEIRRKAEVLEIETRKNSQIEALTKQHERNFAKIKAYYTGVTSSNLDLIHSLKDELDEMHKRQAANEQLMFEIAQENRRLTTPLQTALTEVDKLRKTLKEKDHECAVMARSINRVETISRELKAALWNLDITKVELQKTKEERDEIRTKFENAVHDVALRGIFRETLLEKKVSALSNEVETKSAQISEILAAANLDGAVVNSINSQLDAVLDSKNRSIRELSFELARVMRLYNEAIRVFKAKMSDAGIVSNDLEGFRPFEIKGSNN